jgi:hypothetical protein
LGIREPSRIANLDETVYPITITEPNFIELADEHHEPLPITGDRPTKGTAWAAFDVGGPIGNGTVLLGISLIRGLYSVGFICDTNETTASRKILLRFLSNTGAVYGTLNFFIGATGLGGSWPNRFGPIPLWCDSGKAGEVAALQLVTGEALGAATRAVGGLWAVRHQTDTQT